MNHRSPSYFSKKNPKTTRRNNRSPSSAPRPLSMTARWPLVDGKESTTRRSGPTVQAAQRFSSDTAARAPAFRCALAALSLQKQSHQKPSRKLCRRKPTCLYPAETQRARRAARVVARMSCGSASPDKMANACEELRQFHQVKAKKKKWPQGPGHPGIPTVSRDFP